MKKKKKNLLLIIAILLVSVIGVSFAVTVYESYTINKVSTPTIKNVIVEEYTAKNDVYPGDTISKKVNVKNTGTVDSLVRVKVTKVWGSSRDGSGNIIADNSLDTSNITINYNTSKWINGNDGYYYYMDILKPGVTTTQSLFDNFTVSSDTSNDYQGKTADIVVEMESIQAAGNAIASMWNKSYDFIGVTRPNETVDLGKTEVTFLNTTDKFNIETSKIDLFKNFKDLLPGTGRSQTITVKNADSQSREIYLRAESTTQSSTSTTEINKILKDFVKITIKEGSTILYNGPVNGNYDVTPSGTNSMKENISLGTFASNASKDLVVTLTVDPTMGNEYQNLIGNIKWVFGVEETSGSVLVHHYLEGTTVRLSPDQEINGNTGDAYTTSAAALGTNYQVVATPANSSGTISAGQTVVTYYYKLKNPIFAENPTITKTATDKITSSGSKIDYTITYTASVSAYKGNLTYTIVDTLPQTIDVANSNLDGGTYNATNKTITWTSSSAAVDTYTNGTYTINVTKHLSIKYSSLDYVSKVMTNSVTGNIAFDKFPTYTNPKTTTASTDIDVKGKVTAHYYIDGTTTELASDEVTTGNVSTAYTTESKTFSGYGLVSAPANASGNYIDGNIVVTYYYKLTGAAFTTEPSITKTATDKVTNSSTKINYVINYGAKIHTYKGNGTLTIVDTLPQTIDVANSDIAGGSYNATNKTITWTINLSGIDTYVNGDYNIAFSKTLNIKYTSLNYDSKVMINNVKGTLDLAATGDNLVTNASDSTDIDVKGKVTAHYYVKDTTIELASDVVTTNNVGVAYTTPSKTFTGYTLVAAPTNAAGNYIEGDIVVNYYYSLNNAIFTTSPTISKTATNKITSSASKIDYTINYSAKMHTYKGNGTLTIVDTLPETIDVANSNIAGGSYNATNKTITWTVNLSNIDTYANGDYDISFSKTLNIKFSSLHYSAGSMTNNVKGTLDLDTTGEKKEATASATTALDIKGKVTAHYYVKDTTIELASDVVTTGNVSAAYTTENKTFTGYTLVAAPTNAAGNYIEGDIVVNYYYSLNNAIFTTSPTISKTATDKITSSTAKIDYTINYSAKIHTYKGNGTLTIVDTLPETIDVANSNIAGGSYNATNKTITWTVNLSNIDTYANGDYDISFSKTLNIKFSSLHYSAGSMTNNVKGTLDLDTTGEKKEVTASATTTLGMKGKVTAHYYVNGTTHELATDVVTTGNIGSTYTTENKTFAGYTLVAAPSNATGNYIDGAIVVTYYYNLKNAGFTNAPSLTKTATDKLTSSSGKIAYTINYNAKISTYYGNGTLTIVDTLPETIDVANSDIAGGSYNAANKTITWTVNLSNIDTYANGDYDISFSKTLNIKYTALDYATKVMTNNVKGTLNLIATNENKELTASDSTDIDIKGKVTAHYYVKDTTHELATDVVTNGNITSAYTTTAKTFTNYTLVAAPANATGNYVDGEIVVTYYYVLNKASFTTAPTITKTATDKITSSGSKISYNVNYNAKLSVYMGNAILTIVDTLPETIDVANSDIAGGSYNATNKTITWTVNLNDIDTYTNGDYNIAFSKTLNIKYTSLDYATKVMTNNVKGTLNLVATNENKEVTANDSTDIDIKGKVKVHYYIKDTTTELASDVEITGNIGAPYSTESKTFSGYGLTATPANATGNYIDGDIVVTYYYKLTGAAFTNEPEITKTATDKITSSATKIDYTINYSAKIHTYKGNGTLTIVDTLPETIDVANSNIAGGSYNATNKTITWTVNLSGIDTYINGDYDISFSKSLSIKYTALDYANKVMINNVSGTLDLDATGDHLVTNANDSTDIDIKGKVTTHYYVNGTTHELASDVVTNANVGTAYTTENKSFVGYTLVAVPSNAAGNHIEGNIVVTYYYTLDAAIFNVDPAITKTATDKITNSTSKINYTLSYGAKIDTYKGNGTLTIVDTLPQTIDETNSDLDGGIYNATNKTITWTVSLNNIDTYANGKYSITFSKTLNIKYTALDYVSKEMVNNVSSTLHLDATNEDLIEEDDASTEIDVKGKVTSHYYIKDTTTSLAADEVITDNVGENYVTSAKDFYLYNLYEEPTNKNGTYTVSDIDVVYYYTLKDPEYDDETVKEATDAVTSKDDLFTYTIRYSNKVNYYDGSATLIVTDKLPYEIDEANSDIAGGTYNATDKTITWNETYTIDATASIYNVDFTKVIVLKYKDVDYTKGITNSVKSEFTTDETKTTETEAKTENEIPAKVVVNYYLNNTEVKIDDSLEMNGLYGDSYNAIVSSKATNDGYHIVRVDGIASGIMDQDVIVVNYYYEKNTSTSNPNTGDSVIKYVVTMIGSVALLGSSGYFLLFGKRKKRFSN